MRTDIKIIQAVFGFLGALGSGRGWRLYLLFSRGCGVDVCLVNVSRAEVDRFVGSTEGGSGYSENNDGTPLYVAISRCHSLPVVEAIFGKNLEVFSQSKLLQNFIQVRHCRAPRGSDQHDVGLAG
jgi:hypothetical protein